MSIMNEKIFAPVEKYKSSRWYHIGLKWVFGIQLIGWGGEGVHNIALLLLSFSVMIDQS